MNNIEDLEQKAADARKNKNLAQIEEYIALLSFADKLASYQNVTVDQVLSVSILAAIKEMNTTLSKLEDKIDALSKP